MSSECRCHLDEFCFWCEMFRPLEDKLVVVEKERDELRNRVAELEKQLIYYKCPDCSPTDFEYCSDHHSARTEIWAGGDGW